MLSGLTRRFLAAHRRLLVVTLLLQAAQTTAGMFLPYLNADLIDHGVVKGDIGHILRVGAVMLALSLVQVTLAVGGAYTAARLALAVGRDIRGAVFAAVQGSSTQDLARVGVPSLLTRTTGDVQQLQMVVAMIAGIAVTAPFSCIAGVALALRQDVQLSVVIAVAAPLLILASTLVIVGLQPRAALQQRRIDSINRLLREQISGMRVIRAFVREPDEQRRFAEANDDLTTVALDIGQRMAVVFPIVLVVSNLSSVAVLWLGGHLVDSGTTPVGTVSAFLTYLTQVLTSVTVASFALSLLPRARVSSGRLIEILDARPSVQAPARPLDAPSGGVVRFTDAGYTYPGAEAAVVRGVNLLAEPGTVSVVVGRTGSGKSTLLGMVCRAVDPTEGAATLGGIDVRELDTAALWRRIALVPTRAVLFRGTIATNLRFGDGTGRGGDVDADSDERLWAALRVAQADAFVRELPEGLDAVVAQGGANFSTGQRQRLCIARALVAAPDVLLLDDAFAAMDYATEAAIWTALTEVGRGLTVIAVSQRIGPAIAADQVLMLDEGRPVGVGTHDRLLDTCPAYALLVESQLGRSAR